MLDIFTDNWDNPPILSEGERMLRILTDNPCDELYVIVDDSMDDDEVHDEIQFALRRKLGKAAQYGGFEDSSWICEDWADAQKDANDAWDGAGYYRIGWSDGGMDWTNNGPVYCCDVSDLAGEINSAYCDKTDTHLPYAEKVEVFDQNELEALLGDFIGDYDVDAIIADTTKVASDGTRYWTVDSKELSETVEYYDISDK